MVIHRADQRLHRAPQGWAFVSDAPETEIESIDAELWILRRVGVYE